ncbi:unnamed protein product [Rhodiola kirilowii]
MGSIESNWKMSDDGVAIDSQLLQLCIEAASESPTAIEKWRRQRRTLERLPSHLAEALLHRLLHRRLLQPSLLEVFRNSIECIDLRGQSFVDAEWIAYLGAFKYLSSLNVSDCHRITNSALWPLAGLTLLKEVDLSRCAKVTDTGITYLLTLSTLEKLWISETGLTAQGVTLLSSLENLSSLDLGGLPVTDQVLSSLQVLKRLQYLDLWGTNISDRGTFILKSFTKLTFLNVAWTKVTKLPSLPSLASLNMSNCEVRSVFEDDGDGGALEKLVLSGVTFANVSEALLRLDLSYVLYLDLSNVLLHDLSFIHNTRALTHLDLSFSLIEDDSMEVIRSVGATLRNLNLSNTKVTSFGIQLLAGYVPSLESIFLANTHIDDTSIYYLSMVPQLKVIDLCNTCIKGYKHHADAEPVWVLSDLQYLTSLESLNLEGTQVTDESLLPLLGCKMLGRLSLRNAFLTDMFLHHLSSLPRLTVVGFRDAVLTNKGLQAFLPPLSLKSLDLRGCWLLTEDALQSFCKCYPFIELRHELGHFAPSNKNKFPTFRVSPMKHKKEIVSLALTRPVKDSFIDQRLKYGREELLALQTSVLSLELPPNMDAIRNTRTQ